MLKQLREPRFVDRAGRRQRAVAVHVAEPLRLDEIVERRIGRAGVEGDDIAFAVPPGDVGDAAEIEDRRFAARPDAPAAAPGDRWPPAARPARRRARRRSGNHRRLWYAEQSMHQLAVTELARRARLVPAAARDAAPTGRGSRRRRCPPCQAVAFDQLPDGRRLRARQRLFGFARRSPAPARRSSTCAPGVSVSSSRSRIDCG